MPITRRKKGGVIPDIENQLAPSRSNLFPTRKPTESNLISLRSKLLKQGAYGCTFRPALKCDGESAIEPGTITKLIHPRDAATEMAIRNILAPIDPDQKYFIYPKRSCGKSTQIQSDPDFVEIQKCRPTRTTPKASLLISPDGGVDLDGIPKTAPKRQLFEALYFPMKGLYKLHKAGYVHMDIKPSNMMAGRTLIRFIDFGLTRKSSEWTPDSLFDHTYPWYPFELHLLNKRSDALSDAQWTKFLEGSLAYTSDFRDISPWSDGETFPRPAIVAHMQAVLKNIKDVPDKMGPRILMATDIYALGRTLEETYYRMTGHSMFNGDIVYMTDKGSVILKTASADDITKMFPDRAAYEKELKLAEFSEKWLRMTAGLSDPFIDRRWSLLGAMHYYDAEIRPLLDVHFPSTGARRITRRKNSQR